MNRILRAMEVKKKKSERKGNSLKIEKPTLCLGSMNTADSLGGAKAR